MVHPDGFVADTRRFGFEGPLCINVGSADSSFRDALTEYMIALADVQAA